MRRYRSRWAGGLALAAASMVLLVAGRLSAQAPVQRPGIPWSTAFPVDESSSQLFSGPDGQVFRLVQRSTDLEAGGSGGVLSVAEPQGTWRTLLELLPSEPGVSGLNVDVAFGASKDVALAYQLRRHNPRVKQVRVARSQDGGKTWIHPSTAIEGSGAGFTPRVAWGREGSLVVAWADERRSSRAWDVYARRSPDGGVTWEAEQLVSRFSQQNKSQDVYYAPVIAGDGRDRFWIVWQGVRNGRSSIFSSRSSDGGKTWTDPVALSGQSKSVFGPQLLRSGDRLLLVWSDGRTGRDRIYAVNSPDGGATWSSPTRVDHLPDDAQTSTGTPSLVLGQDGEVFATWGDGRHGRSDIFFGRSTDGGSSWGTEDIRLDMDEPGTAISQFPKIARAQDGRLAIAWEDDRAGYEGVYLRVRTAGPSPAWGPETLIAPPGPKKSARMPSLRWGPGGALYVTWGAWDYTWGPLSPAKLVDGRILFPGKE